MEEDEPHRPSHLFTLRLWPEVIGGQQTEWRGKVQHIGTGVTRYFRDWEGLVRFLTEALSRDK